MQYELLAVILILFCLLILGIEYLWLAVLAKNQEDSKNKYETASRKVASMVEAILYCPTKKSRDYEIDALKKLMGNDSKIFEMISACLCFWEEYGDDETLGNKSAVIDEIYNAIEPVKLFTHILKTGKKYNIGYACRRLADFDAYDYIDDIVAFTKNKNRNVSYNAAMALSRLGYTEGVANYIIKIQDDKKYSFRLINELFDNFSCDRAELATEVLKNCNEYMKCTVIKAITRYKLMKFEQLFKDGVVSKDSDMRIACVKALGGLANPRNEHLLLIAAKDKEWVVRSSAVRGLQKLNTPNALNGIKEATKDKEWWVRQAASGALIDMNVKISELEEILGGYDKYASDAIKYAIYRSINIKEN